MGQESLDEWADDGWSPERCLSVTISGPWGHFRRVEGNVVKQTYRIIPRTTIAGLLAAVLGIERDGYYELFGRDSSRIAIEPVNKIRTVNMPINSLSTAAENLRSLNGRGKISVKIPDPTDLRQQHNYEVLVEPAYRIDVTLRDQERYAELRGMLDAGRSHYIPSLGLSEYLAELEYHGEFAVETESPSGAVEIDSAVPNAVDSLIVEAGVDSGIEESPAFMTTDDAGRTTTAFTTYAYNTDGGSLRADGVETARVGDRTVVFV